MGTLYKHFRRHTGKEARAASGKVINSIATDHAFSHYKKNLQFPSTKDHAIIFHENKSFLPNLKWL